MLVLVLLKFFIVFIFLKEEALAELITALDALNVLIDATIDVRSVSIDDLQLLEEVEVCHVDHSAVHLAEADLLYVAKHLQ